MRIPCQAGQRNFNPMVECDLPAAEYILYGCLEQHTFEMALCYVHAYNWMTIQKKYKHVCRGYNCNRFIVEWFSVEINRLAVYNGE